MGRPRRFDIGPADGRNRRRRDHIAPIYECAGLPLSGLVARCCRRKAEMALSEQSRNVTTPPANKRCGQGPPQRSRSGFRSCDGPGSKGRRAVLRVGAVPSRSITRAQCRKGETVALIGIFATLYVWAASANGAAMGVENRSVLGAMFGICALLAAGDLKSARAQNLDNPT